MEAEITALEERLGKLLDSHANLRADNRRLADRVGSLETENQSLNEKLQRAIGTVASVLERLPESEDE